MPTAQQTRAGGKFLSQQRAGCTTGDDKRDKPMTPQQQPATYRIGDELSTKQLAWWAAFRGQLPKMDEAA